jgi:hypothetical protein
MPFNGNGTFVLPDPPLEAGEIVSADEHNTTRDDMATGFTNCVTRDGQSPAVANLPMGTYKHTNVGASNSLTNYARTDQVQNDSFHWLTSVSGTNTITAATGVAPAAYAAGQRFAFVPANDNTGPATININSLGAKSIKLNGTDDVYAGFLSAGTVYTLIYDGTAFQVATGRTSGIFHVERFSGDGSETEFTLSHSAISENYLLVYIYGVYQQKDTYTFSGNTLTFSTAPPIGTDNIEVVISSTLALGETDASQVEYTLPATGAVTQTVENKLAQTVSVKDFGAVGDGVTDDTDAIQAAIDYVGTDGGCVNFPAGKYLVTSTINVLRRGIWLNGAGSGDGGTWIVNGSTNTPAIQFGDGITRLFRNGISKMLFGQQSGVTAVAGNCAILIDTCSDFTSDNISIANFPSAHYNGIVFSYVGQSQISILNIENCLNDGIYITDNSFDIYINQSRSDGNSANGWNIESLYGGYFSNCTAYNNGNYAWYIHTKAGMSDYAQNLFFVNCVGDTSGNHNWYITGIESFFLSNCWGSTQQSTSVNPNATGFLIYGNNVIGGFLSNCVANFNNGSGLQIYNAKQIDVVGGQWGRIGNGNGQSGFGAGIYIDSGAEDVTLTSIQATNNTHGIVFASGNVRCNTLGGNVNGNSGASIHQPQYAQSIRNVSGFNPHTVTTPAFPASGVAVTNNTGVDCNVYFSGAATISQIQINGRYVANSSPCTLFLPAGSSVTVIYTIAPVWAWIGN